MTEPKKTLSLSAFAAKKAETKIAEFIPAIVQEPIPVPPSEPEQADTDTLPQSIRQSTIAEIMQRVEYRFDTFANTVLCHGLLIVFSLETVFCIWPVVVPPPR